MRIPKLRHYSTLNCRYAGSWLTYWHHDDDVTTDNFFIEGQAINKEQKVETVTDEAGLELDTERDSEIEVPFDPTKIDIIVKSMAINTLQNRLENRELDLTPDFQRQANVWNMQRKSRLIESVLLRIPLPSFYFSEDVDGVYAVVDGLQRLCSIFHFSNVELLNSTTGASLSALRLVGLQYLKDLEGKSFSEMERKFQRRISELEITANIIRSNTPPAVKFNVFARLNQGGMPLNAQEIRNAIFPGAWREQLRLMAESSAFLEATDGKISPLRQDDLELVLRFVALWQLGVPHQRGAKLTLDEFLNQVVEHTLSQWSEKQWREVGGAFERALKAACDVFGTHAFRKSIGRANRMPINRGLFEAELVCLADLKDSELETLIHRKDKIAEVLREALQNDADFDRALLYATGSADASNVRLSKIHQIFHQVLDA